MEVRWHPILIGVTVMKLMGLPPILDIPLKGNYIKREVARYQTLYHVATRRDPSHAPISALAASRAMALLSRENDATAVLFAKACYHAYWQDEVDLGQGRSGSINSHSSPACRQRSRGAILGNAGKEALHAEMDDAVARGVFGSPFFIIHDEPFFGVDKMELMEFWLYKNEPARTL